MNQEWMIFLSRQMKPIQPCMEIPYLPGFHLKPQVSAGKAASFVFLERGVQQIVGTYVESKSFGFVIPDDKKFASDIFIPKVSI